jgi:hypothetical protein
LHSCGRSLLLGIPGAFVGSFRLGCRLVGFTTQTAGGSLQLLSSLGI